MPQEQTKEDFRRSIYDNVLGLTLDENNQPYYSKLVDEDQISRFNEFMGNSLGSLLNDRSITETQIQLDKINTGRSAFLERISNEGPVLGLAGSTNTNTQSVFINKDGIATKDWMSFWEMSGLSNVYGNNVEFMGSSTAAFYYKTLYGTSNALLEKSMAWPSIKAELEKKGTLEQEQFIADSLISPSTFGKAFKTSVVGQTLFGPVYNEATTQLPLISSIKATVINPELTLFQAKDPDFNPNSLVDSIKEMDPDFWSFLQSVGVEENELRTANNIFDFRFRLNTTVLNDALAKSAEAETRRTNPIVKGVNFTADMAISSIDSPDFAGQVLIAVSTAGLGNLAAGAATLSTKIGSATATTAARTARIASIATKMQRVGSGIKKVKDYLPVNIASTLLEGSNKAWKTNKLLKYVVGPAATEFVEEGAIDVVNQLLNIHVNNTQISYDFERTFDASVSGALAAPLLAGTFKIGVDLPIAIVSYTGGYVGNWATNRIIGKTINVNPTRFREFRLYYDNFTGRKFEDKTPAEQQMQIAGEVRALVVEGLLNEMTDNQFGRLDDEKNLDVLGGLEALTRIDMATDDTNQRSMLDVVVAVNDWLSNVSALGTTDTTTGKFTRKIQPFMDKNPGFFRETKDGKLVMSKEAMETVLLVVSAASKSNSTEAVSISTSVLQNMLVKKLFDAEVAKGTPKEEIPQKVEDAIQNETEDFVKAKESIENLGKVATELVGEVGSSDAAPPESGDKEIINNTLEVGTIVSDTVEKIVQQVTKVSKTTPVVTKTEPSAWDDPETAQLIEALRAERAAESEKVKTVPTAPEAAPEVKVSATITNAIDTDKAINIVKAKPELISLISKICK
jgi:hypothetical protein